MSAPTSGLACSRAICVPRRVDPAKLAGEIEVALGIRLMAKTSTDAVHGHISTLEKNVDAEMAQCPMCEGGPFAEGEEHHCVEVVLYEEEEAPRAKGRFPHDSRLLRHGLTAGQLVQLRALVQAHRG